VVDRDDVERARARIGDRLLRTPTLRSTSLGARLKCELFQRTGSFKSRGALNKLSTLSDDEKRRGVIAISAGNHAQAVAYAAAAEGVDALVVMWASASPQKIAATRGYGATVDLTAHDPTSAFARLDELIAETGRTLVHPFDDPVVLAGAGTVGLEIE
jgi:threonine dehydratase